MSIDVTAQMGLFGSDYIDGDASGVTGAINTEIGRPRAGWTLMIAEGGAAVVKAICSEGSAYSSDGTVAGAAKTLAEGSSFVGPIRRIDITSGKVRAYRRSDRINQ